VKFFGSDVTLKNLRRFVLGSQCMSKVTGICDFVCVCGTVSVCPQSKRKTTWAINTKLCTHILLGRNSVYIDP